MEIRYSNEENVQILIELLKQHNIKKVVASPGTTNINFVASVQNDNFFEIYSCVDERSAAYLACGMSYETGEPVVITCTGATASRNYMAGLTEAYYRKLPIIAITATQHLGKIGQNVAQVVDRTAQLNDIVKKSIQLPTVHSNDDRWSCNLKINEVLLETKRDGGGPVHINLTTTYDNSFNCNKLPKQRVINRYYLNDILPEIKDNKIAIFIGNHKKIDKILEDVIEKFCEKYNAIVLCDQTSNYHGKYKIMGNLICGQFAPNPIKTIDLVIDIGDVSGSYMGFIAKNIWRVNPDGEIRDTHKKLTKIFAMTEYSFFNYYNSQKNENSTTSYYDLWKNADEKLRDKLSNQNIPFSNIWITKNSIDKYPEDTIIHLGILNTLRSWNLFNEKNKLNINCNTGGFGIDGIMSSAFGASLCTDKPVYCLIGDLAFFYDLNSIGNKNLKNNLRILLVNNGCGTEFHNYSHRAVEISSKYNFGLENFAADGHFGNKSPNLVKHYAEDLGFKYITASNKEEFLENIDDFIVEKSDKPIIFEVYTNPADESKALHIINNLDTNYKSKIKKILGNEKIKKIKKIIKK